MRKNSERAAFMNSRTQIIERLLELDHFKFVAYIHRLNSDTHIVRLDIRDFHCSGKIVNYSIQDFIITEHPGRLEAKSMDGTIRVEKLT